MKTLILLIFAISTIDILPYQELNIPTRIEGSKKILKADLYSSDTNKAKPTILIQTPYNKNNYRITYALGKFLNQILYDSINYNYVIVDWRGFYANKEQDSTGYNRGQDGFDIIEWIANQKWSNGKIGTWGGSALGHIQFLTAAENPPHLVCSAPFIKDFKTKYEDSYYGGVYRKEHNESIEKLGLGSTALMLSHYEKDAAWKFIENQNKIAENIKVPMFLCTGWFDHYPSDVIRAWEDLREKSNSNVKNQHKLIIGPWLHDGIGELKQGEMEFPDALSFSDIYGKAFLDNYLIKENTEWQNVNNITYYTINSGWKFSDDWKNIQKSFDTLYLNEGKMLTDYPPFPKMSPLEQFPDTIVYNPKYPSPTIGGSRFNPFIKDLPTGPRDISKSVENRNDVLIYSTEILKEDFQIIGKTKIKLFISSDKKDTDFSVRLCDVDENDKSIIITQGITRARYRKSTSKAELLIPGERDSINVELSDLSYNFRKGHKVRIDISSSNFPMFDINLNNGGELYKSGDTLIATNLIYRTNVMASKVIFGIPSKIVSVDKEIIGDEIIVYPNPAKDYIIIENLYEENKIELFNSIGNKVHFSENTNRIMLNDLQNGIYFLKILVRDKTIYKKFVLIK